MATLRGINNTIVTTEPREKLDPGVFDGRVKILVDTYEASAADIGDIILIGPPLPKGARIQEVILHTDDLDNNSNLAVGDAEDPDRYITATNHGAGSELITRLNAIAGRDYEVDKSDSSNLDDQIRITISNAAATGTIKLTVFFTHD